MGQLKEFLEAGNFTMAGTTLHGLYSDALVAWNRKASVRDGKLHASSLLETEGEFCYREHVLDMDYIRQEKEWPLNILNVLHYGWELHISHQEVMTYQTPDDVRHAIENQFMVRVDNTISGEIIDERVKKAALKLLQDEFDGLALEVETRHFYEPYNLSYTPDAIIECEGIPFVWEIKGYRQSEFEKIASYDPMISYDYRKAVHQANLYMHFLEIEYAGIFIENKANQQYLIRVVKYDRDMAMPYIARAEVLVAHKATHRQNSEHIPNRICQSREDARARRCPFRDVCFANSWEERRQWLKKQ